MTTTSQVVAGSGLAFIEGIESLSIRDGLEFEPQNVMRESMINQDGTIAYKESPRSAKIKFTASLSPGVKATDVFAVVSKTVMADMPGRSFTLSNATFTGETSINAEEGTYDCEFEGTSMDEEIS